MELVILSSMATAAMADTAAAPMTSSVTAAVSAAVSATATAGLDLCAGTGKCDDLRTGYH